MKIARKFSNLKRIPGVATLLHVPGARQIAKLTYAYIVSFEIINEPDRKFLVNSIFPAVKRIQPRKLLFVGCKRYTAGYCSSLGAAGVECWTIDIDAASARWGAGNKHIIGDFQTIESQCDVLFDVVIMNGVFGFGLDTVSSNKWKDRWPYYGGSSELRIHSVGLEFRSDYRSKYAPGFQKIFRL